MSKSESESPPYSCEDCGRVFLTLEARCGHRNAHVGPQSESRRDYPKNASRAWRRMRERMFELEDSGDDPAVAEAGDER